MDLKQLFQKITPDSFITDYSKIKLFRHNERIPKAMTVTWTNNSMDSSEILDLLNITNFSLNTGKISQAAA